MPEIVWYRSLYWRIALGFIALLAALLAAQGLVFLWLTGRAAELLPGRSPEEYAHTIGSDLTAALATNRELDLDAHLNARYQSTYRAFVVVTRDGRSAVSRRSPPPPGLTRAAFGYVNSDPPPSGPPKPGMGLGPPPPFPGRGPRPGGEGGPGPGREGPARRGPGPPALVFAPVVIDGEMFGLVVVISEPRPLSAALRDLGPALAVVAVGLLVAGTSVGALLIFRPTHRRLRSLQDAARAIGEGQTGVRASASGGDEVAVFARAFNEMAGGLEQRTRALVEADGSRRQLLADVSHELMTPLAAIRGYVETMAMPDLNLDVPTRRRYLQIVGEETERMEHIIGDLLDLAGVEGGGGEWKREAVSIAALFERVRDRHDPVLRRKRITLEHTIAPDVADVAGDANRLEQAIQNLATNAVRHTPEGGRVRLAADRVPDGVRLVVEDTGSGIPMEHLARIFDRFYKADVSRTTTEVPSGSGLGLSIVQAIVRHHGGRISAANGPHGGARFEVVLPPFEPAGPADS